MKPKTAKRKQKYIPKLLLSRLVQSSTTLKSPSYGTMTARRDDLTQNWQ